MQLIPTALRAYSSILSTTGLSYLPTQPEIQYHRVGVLTQQRFMTDGRETAFCKCSQKKLSSDIEELFIRRKLRNITGSLKCKQLRHPEFKPNSSCRITNHLLEISELFIKEFPDVINVNPTKAVVLIEALNEIPHGKFGDITGDHGKELSRFISDCLEARLLQNIGALYDIGGQNNSTSSLICQTIKNETLPCLVIDINLITPAISQYQENIKYVIDDSVNFFNSTIFHEYKNNLDSKKSSIFIFNNMLNVLPPETGWANIETVWKVMQADDYLIISGLSTEQFESSPFLKYHDFDGIVAFHNAFNREFYKSALSNEFVNYLGSRLPNARVLCKETFEFEILDWRKKELPIKGRRFLTLKKGIEASRLILSE